MPAILKVIRRGGKIALALAILAVMAAIVELFAAGLMTEDCRIGRRILRGDEDAHLIRMQNTIGQSYLNYICAPNFSREQTGQQHNEDGYRGRAVPLDKRPGVLRILCLGGSTTYGWSVAYPHETYPAVLEELVRADLPPGYDDVEVINAGLPWGTSAEILTHYHFKFHYYQPDIVVVNAGGNDANAYTYPYYHPDNSNWRQPLVNLGALPPRWRWLARSRAASLAILKIFYSPQLSGGQLHVRGGVKPAAAWFRPGGELLREPSEIPLDRLSFAHNLETLIREIQSDGARVLLVPFRANPDSDRIKEFEMAQVIRHERILKDFADTYQTGYAPFPAAVISPANWTDHCHLNAAGERQKAAHIAGYINELAAGPTGAAPEPKQDSPGPS